MRVLVTPDVYDRFPERLPAVVGPTPVEWVRTDFANRDGTFPTLLKTADVIVTRSDLTEEDYAHARRLKLIQLPIAGYEAIDLRRAARHGIPVSNNGGANAISVSEHVFLLVLALYRHLLHHHASVVDGSWSCLKDRNIEMAGKTVGIIGLGNIGRAVASRASAFGMAVRYFDIRRPDPDVERQCGATFASFDELLAIADIVTLHVPLTRRTRRLVDQAALRRMKSSAVLINTSRGEVIDEDALAEALATGRLSGAGLDVFWREPLPADSALLRLDNVVLTPHAGPSRETRFRMIEHVIANVARVARGEAPAGVVVDYDGLEEVTT